jgi:hypothetical protein
VETTEEGKLILDYPAMIVPIPPQQAGGMQNQIGFGKFMPFSDYSKEITLHPEHIVADSESDANIVNAYEQWVTHMRAQASGIVLTQNANVPAAGAAKGFGDLNI